MYDVWCMVVRVPASHLGYTEIRRFIILTDSFCEFYLSLQHLAATYSYTTHHISSRMLYNQFKASLIVTNNIPAYVVLNHRVIFCLPLFLLPYLSSVSIARILFLLSVSVIMWVHPSFTDIFRCFFPFSGTPF